MVLGLTFDHRIADAYSFNMFLLAWSEIASGKQISTVPSFRRSLVSPRRPGSPDPSIDRLFVPVSQLPPPANSSDSVNRIYYIASADVDRLQDLASEPGGRKPRTKLEAFTAYLWKLVGAGSGKQASRMGVVVDGRRRLGPAMDAYFGNVLSIPYATASVGAMEVKEVAEIVRGVVAGAASEGHFRGLVDWVEARRPEAAVARVYAEGGLSVVVSSGRGFPVRAVEFGWGKAAFGSYHFPWEGSAGYVMPMPSAKGGGDWVVYAHLPRELAAIVEDDSGGVFRPITADYLGLK